MELIQKIINRAASLMCFLYVACGLCQVSPQCTAVSLLDYSNTRESIDYQFQKAYNEFVPYPSLPLYTE
jgi:hypothetical protein